MHDNCTKALENLINESYAAGDYDALTLAVFSLVRLKYRGSRYVVGSYNTHLASIVALELTRRLPDYAGSDKLSTYNGRIPLSHYVNMLAASRHRDELRKLQTLQAHETMACDLAQVEGADVDSITYLSDQQQSCPDPARSLAVQQFIGSLPSRQMPALVRCITEGRITDNERKTLQKVLAQAERFGLKGQRASVVCGCQCWNCNRNRGDIPPRRKRPADDWVSIPTQRYR